MEDGGTRGELKHGCQSRFHWNCGWRWSSPCVNCAGQSRCVLSTPAPSDWVGYGAPSVNPTHLRHLNESWGREVDFVLS